MAVLIQGPLGATWSAPDWIGRNAWFFLAPRLREMHHGRLLAKRLEDAARDGAHAVELTDLLADPLQSNAWTTAVRTALERINAEPASDWNLPAMQAPFVAAFARLLELVPQPASDELGARLEAQNSLDAVAIFKIGLPS